METEAREMGDGCSLDFTVSSRTGAGSQGSLFPNQGFPWMNGALVSITYIKQMVRLPTFYTLYLPSQCVF